MTIVKCGKQDFDSLAAIWERSVRATHLFLTEEDIAEIRRALIPDYFPNVNLYALTDTDGKPLGFIGLAADMIEMLFIDAAYRGRGYGSRLIDFAKERGATRVDVNEQNPDALRFYLGHGFHIAGRDATDDSGRPFPILHLSL